MAYKVIILYQLYMPSYFLGTFTEYPYLRTKNKKEKTLTGKISIPPISILLIVKSQKSAPHRSSIGEQAFIAFIFGIRGYPDFKITGFRSVFHF